MTDIDNFDLDATTAWAWQQFTARLAEVISVMDASVDLTISVASSKSNPPSIRFRAVAPGTVEALLSAVDDPRLQSAGWRPGPQG